MERYKAILSNGKIYREVDLEPDLKALRVGTGKDSAVRLDSELFFDDFYFDLENENDNWTLVCGTNNYATVDSLLKVTSRQLSHGDCITLRSFSSQQIILTINFVLDFEYEYKDYERVIDIADTPHIVIGGAPNCNIYLEDPLISGDCIMVENTHGKLNVHDNGYQYGVYVNGIRIQDNAEVKDYDFFSIIGYSFYYKFGNLYTSKTSKMQIEDLPNGIIPESDSRFEYPCFNRNTRVKDPLPDSEIGILDPPQAPEKKKENVMLQIVPAVAMMGVVMMMATTNTSGAGSSLSMTLRSAAMVGVTILVAFLGIISSKREFKKETEKRDTVYRAYIDKKKEEVQGKRQMERGIREEVYCSPEIELERIRNFSSDLFDRVPGDSDFMYLRLGTGPVVSCQPLAFKEQETLEIGDELMQLPAALASEFKSLPAAPIVLDGNKTGAIGIVGSRPRLYDMLKVIMLDIGTRHYYDDVRMFLLVSEASAASVAWSRLLPHLYNEATGTRSIVCDEESKNILFEYLYKELARREAEQVIAPRIVIFSYNDQGIKSHPISNYFPDAASLGITFLFFEERKHNLPLGCGKIIKLENSDTSGTVVSSGDNNQNIIFSYEPIDEASAAGFAQKLAPVYCEEVSLESNLTKSISLFELLDIYSVRDLDLAQRWQQSEIHNSMAAPLGVNAKNGIVYLDLHEKYHGPHGLVAGTTGSGKSEILQSYILSMATLFHPYEVGFVIIDFKGGGMVNQFKNLPHLNGAITNIDGREIDRSLLSIRAELRKRQELFSQANVNHINAYIQLFKKGEVSIPLPHLILVVDEFAELKTDQPEFMKELISAARIGRSLGVHLILATQKPSGVVDDQIWSNSRFKLCLKVQNQGDSNEVLRSPLAAEIREPGRAYFQVGNNEIFELFQSAYSGAPAVANADQKKRFKLYSVNLWGKKQLVFEQKPDKASDDEKTQLDAIVEYIADYAEQQKIEKLPGICLPSLREVIPYTEAQPVNQGAGGIEIAMGVYDDPNNQLQAQYNLDILDGNTFIVGATQYGKTAMLQSMIRGISEQYTPDEVSIYILDFASMALMIFDDLAHVGGIVTPSEDIKLKTFFRIMEKEVAVRKDKFSKLGISSFAAYREGGFTDLPFILIALDNLTAFRELYEDFDDRFLNICREGLAVGIGVVATTVQTRSLGYKYLSNFGNRVALYCNSRDEYSTIFERCRMEPKDTPGRALISINKEIYEYQNYLPFEGEKEIDRVNDIKAFTASINARTPQRARRIPEVPTLLTPAYIEDSLDPVPPYTVVAGMDFNTVDAVPVNMLKTGYLAVSGREKSGKANFVRYILSTLNDYDQKLYPTESYIIDGYERKLHSVSALGVVKQYSTEIEDLGPTLKQLDTECTRRKSLVMQNGIEALDGLPLLLLVIQNGQFFEPDAVSKETIETIKRLLKTSREVKLFMMFTNMENAPIPYGANDIQKQIKETRNVVFFDDIAAFKPFDIPLVDQRANRKPIELGDGFFILEREVVRMKTPLVGE